MTASPTPTACSSAVACDHTLVSKGILETKVTDAGRLAWSRRHRATPDQPEPHHPDELLAELTKTTRTARGPRARPRQSDARHIDGSMRHNPRSGCAPDRRRTTRRTPTPRSAAVRQRGQRPHVEAERTRQRPDTRRELDITSTHRRGREQVDDEIQARKRRRHPTTQAYRVPPPRPPRESRPRPASSTNSAAAAHGCRTRSAPPATPARMRRPPPPP